MGSDETPVTMNKSEIIYFFTHLKCVALSMFVRLLKGVFFFYLLLVMTLKVEKIFKCILLLFLVLQKEYSVTFVLCIYSAQNCSKAWSVHCCPWYCAL